MNNHSAPELSKIVITAIEAVQLDKKIDLSAKLRVIRENVFSLARPAFAELIDMPASTWKNYELKYRCPDVTFLSNLMRVLKTKKEVKKDKVQDIILLLVNDELTGNEFLAQLTLCCEIKSYHHGDKIAWINRTRAQERQEKMKEAATL